MDDGLMGWGGKGRDLTTNLPTKLILSTQCPSTFSSDFF